MRKSYQGDPYPRPKPSSDGKIGVGSMDRSGSVERSGCADHIPNGKAAHSYLVGECGDRPSAKRPGAR
ncbi:MAG TPA: hypothetical protein DIU35_00485 [Candidatus Latescibacteria bacterium]|nr:hypothetical protein [Candidatus Latescibacterota bacterium]